MYNSMTGVKKSQIADDYITAGRALIWDEQCQHQAYLRQLPLTNIKNNLTSPQASHTYVLMSVQNLIHHNNIALYYNNVINNVHLVQDAPAPL